MTAAPTPTQVNSHGPYRNGCDNLTAIEGMARIAMDEQTPQETRWRIFATLAQYVAPKRKAVELSGGNGGPIAVDLSAHVAVLADGESQTLLRLLEKAGMGALCG